MEWLQNNDFLGCMVFSRALNGAELSGFNQEILMKMKGEHICRVQECGKSNDCTSGCHYILHVCHLSAPQFFIFS